MSLLEGVIIIWKNMYDMMNKDILCLTEFFSFSFQYNIRSYPTTVFYNQSVPHSFSGYHTADDLVEFVLVSFTDKHSPCLKRNDAKNNRCFIVWHSLQNNIYSIRGSEIAQDHEIREFFIVVRAKNHTFCKTPVKSLSD